MAYGKITKVRNGKEKSKFQKKYFSLLLEKGRALIQSKTKTKPNPEGVMEYLSCSDPNQDQIES